MPTITPTVSRDVGDRDGSVVTWTWTLTTANADGAVLEWPEWADRTFTATGTWGGATLSIQGSGDGTNWVTLNKVAGGTAATATADAAMAIIEVPRYVRPNLTVAGAGATVTVILTARRANPMRT